MNVHIKSIEEEIEGYLYRTVAEVRENGKVKEFEYKIYLNHRARFKDGRISFERKTEYGGKPWNYSKTPIKTALMTIMPMSESDEHFDEMTRYAGGICKIINSAYASQEMKWMKADKA